MNEADFLERLHSLKASAILRTDNQERAALAMEAAVRGGFGIVEFTLTIPGAFDLIRDFSRRSGLIVGAGTVLSAEDARKAHECGAHYLVSPVVEESVIRAAKEIGTAVMAGTHTPTEMWLAYKLGAPLQKLFPAPANGPAFVKACLGPMPFLRIVPTNGVDAGNAATYLKSGAFGVGFTNALFDAGDIRSGRYDSIESSARALLSSLSI